MDTTTATRSGLAASALIAETVPPTAAPLPNLPAPVAEPPKPSKLADAWDRIKNSPHGRTLQTLAAGMGGFLSGVAPPVLLAGVGYAVGGHNAYELSAGFGVAAGLIGGGLLDTIQFESDRNLVPTFKRLGSKYPYFMSCLNVTLCAGVPAAVAGMAASHYFNGGWGVAAGVVGGVLGAIYCAMVQEERVKDADTRAAQSRE